MQQVKWQSFNFCNEPSEFASPRGRLSVEACVHCVKKVTLRNDRPSPLVVKLHHHRVGVEHAAMRMERKNVLPVREWCGRNHKACNRGVASQRSIEILHSRTNGSSGNIKHCFLRHLVAAAGTYHHTTRVLKQRLNLQLHKRLETHVVNML